MVFKIVINEPKTKKSFQIEKDAPSLIGLKIGSKFDGNMVGLDGFTLQVTGGSDKEGFPMRPDLEGVGRKKLLLKKSVGFKGLHIKKRKGKKLKYKVKGLRKRKYVRGNAISDNIAQVNCKILEGEGDIGMMLGIKKEEGKEAPKTEKKEEPKKEEIKTEEKKETSKEEKKVEPKKEDKVKKEEKSKSEEKKFELKNNEEKK